MDNILGDMFKSKKNNGNLKNIVILIIVGVILNIAGFLVVEAFNIPIYFDTLGTIIVSALSGYLPGILVGFLTNVIKSLQNSAELYYGTVNMIVAVVVTFMVRRGFFEKKIKAIFVVITLVLTAGVMASGITWFLDYSGEGSLTASKQIFSQINEGLPVFMTNLGADLKKEVIDKGITVFLGLMCYSFVTPNLKKQLKVRGLWQASLPDEIWYNIKKRKNRKYSLRLKVSVVILSGAVFIAIIATSISFMLFKKSTIAEHIQMADGIAMLVANELDADRVNEYIEFGFEVKGYNDIREKLYKIRDAYKDIEFLYIYQIREDGCHVVFDLDTDDVEACYPGEVFGFDNAFLPYIHNLLSGEEVDPIISDESYGYLLTVYKPLYDSNGKCVCYVGVDFSMKLLSAYVWIFVIREIFLFLGFFIMITAVGVTFTEYNIMLPLNTMAYFAGTFAYDSEEARARNVSIMKKISIRTGDEIENLYNAFLKTTEDSMEYVENLRNARIVVENMKERVQIMDEIAYKDVLTGVKNKVAYNEYIKVLEKNIMKIEPDIAISHNSDMYKELIDDDFMKWKNFEIIMFDLNFLKKVNDNYGHSCGDIYLVNFAKMLCKIFGYTHTFRIGGDEFVIIMNPDKVSFDKELIEEFKEECEKLSYNKSLNPWEQISAAVGVAYYDKSTDSCFNDVFRRADYAMYDNKVKMKAVRND